MKNRTRLDYILNRNLNIQGHEHCLTKFREETILTYRFDAMIDIDLYQLNVPLYEIGVMSLYATKRDNNEMHIHNINGVGSKGYGTLVFKKFLTHCESTGIELITGDLSYKDLEDNAERLVEFYTKFGGSCKIDESNNEGTMTLRL